MALYTMVKLHVLYFLEDLSKTAADWRKIVFYRGILPVLKTAQRNAGLLINMNDYHYETWQNYIHAVQIH